MAQLNSHIFYGICYVFIPLKILPNFPSDFFFDSRVIKTSSGCLGKGAPAVTGGGASSRPLLFPPARAFLTSRPLIVTTAEREDVEIPARIVEGSNSLCRPIGGVVCVSKLCYWGHKYRGLLQSLRESTLPSSRNGFLYPC